MHVIEDEDKGAETSEVEAVAQERTEWQRPQWRRIDASEAQAAGGAAGDGGVLS